MSKKPVATPKKSQDDIDYEKWQDGIRALSKDAKSSEYDKHIEETVTKYHAFIPGSSKYNMLNARLIKSIIWTEVGSGGTGTTAWKTRPMQIGNKGDPGIDDLLSGKNGGEVVVPKSIMDHFTLVNIRENPHRNIEAGIGYLLMLSANFAFRNVSGSEAPVVYTIKRGDTFYGLAKRKDIISGKTSTEKELENLNPGKKILGIGDTIKFRSAIIEKYVTSWTGITTQFVANRYNTKDKKYQSKLEFCLTFFGN